MVLRLKDAFHQDFGKKVLGVHIGTAQLTVWDGIGFAQAVAFAVAKMKLLFDVGTVQPIFVDCVGVWGGEELHQGIDLDRQLVYFLVFHTN